MPAHPASSHCVETVDTCHMVQHHPSAKVRATTRAKPLSQPRISAIRVEGRQIAAEVLGRVLRDEEASQRSVATVLRVSPELVQRWVDPSSPKQVAVGDLVGVAVAGRPGLVLAYFGELVRAIRPSTIVRRSPLEHAVALTKALGAATVAMTAGVTPREQMQALRVVQRTAEEAIADLGEP